MGGREDIVAEIDARLRTEWSNAGVVPAARADDATFLRRAYVDVVGTIPPLDVTTAFLSDPRPDKRERLVEALLASPDYADHWTNYWDDVLMGGEAKNNLVDRGAFRDWLRGRFAANARWDRLVFELVSATGQNGVGGRKVRGTAIELSSSAPSSESTRARLDEETAPPAGPREGAVNGAVNWTLRYEQAPQDLGGAASRIFLGVQLQCAQCHDHKTERWKQDDFRRFASAFFHAKVAPLEGRAPSGRTRQVELVDAAGAPPRFAKRAELSPIARSKATALDGTDLEKGRETRKALAGWIVSKENPWFAKAFVNRMWGHFLGRGFYDPVDDIRPSNPAAAPALLERIAGDFAAHDFDIAYLVRTICATEAYQLSAAPSGSKADPENKLWGRFHLVPLGPEELLNAILRATALEKTASRVGVKDVDALRSNIARRYAFLFDTDEGDDEPDYSGTVSQALALLNGALVRQGGRALPGSMLGELVRGAGSAADKIDRLTLTVLARHPTDEERRRWVDYVASYEDAASSAAPSKSAPTKPGKRGRDPLDRLASARTNRRGEPALPKQAAYEDVLWTMLNSSEFTFNH